MREVTLLGKKYYFLTWEDVEEKVGILASKVSSYNPTKIVAPLRWGVLVASLLSDYLGVREVYAIGIRFYKGIDETSDEAIIYQPLNIPIKGERVLVVDDVSDSGKTLRKVYEILMSKGVGEVKTATLHIKPWTKFIPDYYCDVLDGWICYPWARNEDIKNIYKLLTRELKSEKALELLKKYNLDRWLKI